MVIAIFVSVLFFLISVVLFLLGLYYCIKANINKNRYDRWFTIISWVFAFFTFSVSLVMPFVSQMTNIDTFIRSSVFRLPASSTIVAAPTSSQISALEELNIPKIYESANYYLETGNYEKAIEKFKEIPESFSDYHLVYEKKQKAEVIYKESILNKANELANQEKYKDAYNILTQALQVLPDDVELLAIGESYHDKIPVEIYYLDYFDKWNGFVRDQGFKDNLGVEWTSGIGSDQYNVYFSEREGEYSYEIYKLNKKYKLLTGTFLLLYDYRSEELGSKIDIIGDNKVLYSSPYLHQSVEPIEIKVDITGVDLLKIQIVGEEDGYGYRHYAHVCRFANGLLHK